MTSHTSTGDADHDSMPVSLAAALEQLRDDTGRTWGEISDAKPTLTILLRHAGCTFCRQTLADLAHARSAILAQGLSIAVIGMSDSSVPLRALGDRVGLTDVFWIADPQRLAYRALEIRRGGFWQLFSPSVVWSGFMAALRGHGIGRVQGDHFQMPGTAVIHRGVVLRKYVHQHAADIPDLGAFACSVTSNG